MQSMLMRVGESEGAAMTSEQIADLLDSVVCTGQPSSQFLQLASLKFLAEIAFQLARQNEMAHPAVTAAMNASPKACDCGMYPHKGTCASLPPGMGGGFGR
jgi:hypothetical protein